MYKYGVLSDGKITKEVSGYNIENAFKKLFNLDFHAKVKINKWGSYMGFEKVYQLSTVEGSPLERNTVILAKLD